MGWPSWRRSDPRLRGPRRPAGRVLGGSRRRRTTPSGSPWRRRAYDTKTLRIAARLWAEALAADPSSATTARPSTATTPPAPPPWPPPGRARTTRSRDDAARASSARRALGWLKAELDAWSKALDPGDPKARAEVAPTLRHWQQDSDLAGVRDEAELARLPEAERADWEALWDEVRRVLAKVREGPLIRPPRGRLAHAVASRRRVSPTPSPPSLRPRPVPRSLSLKALDRKRPSAPTTPPAREGFGDDDDRTVQQTRGGPRGRSGAYPRRPLRASSRGFSRLLASPGPPPDPAARPRRRSTSR